MEPESGLTGAGLTGAGLTGAGLTGAGLTGAGLAEAPHLVAPRLLAARISRAGVTVRLTEVEAYAGEADPGSHARAGRTGRNGSMFGPPGRAYVYFSYGMHWCLNVVTGPEGVAGAVLLRAGEVVAGLERARSRRPPCRRDRDLARGPARLARCLDITGADDGETLDLLLPAAQATAICRGPRVGVAGVGGRVPWRFWLPDEPTVSPYRAARAR